MKLVRNPLGYFEFSPKPTAAELRDYYQAYYANPARQSQYSREYSDEEIQHKQLECRELETIANRATGSLVEIAVGEGFVLDHFARAGWQVHGVDFTDDGVARHHPHLRDRVWFGDIYDYLDGPIEAVAPADVMVCNNVFEHVTDPQGLARRLRGLLRPGGVLRAVVPNDGSWMQGEIVRRGLAAADYWLHPPEHLSYFTGPSFQAMLEEAGFRVTHMMAGFPIELFMLNDDTNYMRDGARGRNCHLARVRFELALGNRSLDELFAFRQGCAAAGIGRTVIAYATPA